MKKTNEELMSKKLKSVKKMMRRLEKELDSERKAREGLVGRIKALESKAVSAKNIQDKLMHNLRLAMNHLGLSPKSPK